MKKFLVTIALLGFGFSAHADHNMEIQINGGFAGTAGGVTINDDKRGDNTPWNLGAEVYKTMSDNFQFGGTIRLFDNDTTVLGQAVTELGYTVGVLGRYNFSADHADSMFAGFGLTYSDLGIKGTDSTRISLHAQFGKRYALSDNITYTPNVAIDFAMGGDTGFDEGTSIAVNFLSFSGFM